MVICLHNDHTGGSTLKLYLKRPGKGRRLNLQQTYIYSCYLSWIILIVLTFHIPKMPGVILDVFSDIDWVLYLEKKGCHIIDMKWKLLTYMGLNSNTKIKVKILCRKFVHFAQISLQRFILIIQNCTIRPPHACMYAWQFKDILLMRRQMVISQIWIREALRFWIVWGETW